MHFVTFPKTIQFYSFILCRLNGIKVKCKTIWIEEMCNPTPLTLAKLFTIDEQTLLIRVSNFLSHLVQYLYCIFLPHFKIFFRFSYGTIYIQVITSFLSFLSHLVLSCMFCYYLLDTIENCPLCLVCYYLSGLIWYYLSCCLVFCLVCCCLI